MCVTQSGSAARLEQLRQMFAVIQSSNVFPAPLAAAGLAAVSHTACTS